MFVTDKHFCIRTTSRMASLLAFYLLRIAEVKNFNQNRFCLFARSALRKHSPVLYDDYPRTLVYHISGYTVYKSLAKWTWYSTVGYTTVIKKSKLIKNQAVEDMNLDFRSDSRCFCLITQVLFALQGHWVFVSCD